MTDNRFAIYKSESPMKPWVVLDNSSNPQEDAVLYRFTSKVEAEAFRQMLENERKAV